MSDPTPGPHLDPSPPVTYCCYECGTCGLRTWVTNSEPAPVDHDRPGTAAACDGHLGMVYGVTAQP